MRKIISFMHMSLDGFVAGPNGEMNWIKVDQEIFDYIGKRIGETDTALYGRVTFQMMEGYWPTAGQQPGASKHDIEHSKWYSKAHKVVLSKTITEEGLANTTIISDNLPERLNEIKQRENSGSEDILLFGSPTATHSLMQLGLIDGYWLFVNPVILGQGIPLYNGSQEKVQLQLITTRQFTSGVTELNYLVKK
jgi:dihydrofolate reductase